MTTEKKLYLALDCAALFMLAYVVIVIAVTLI